MNSLRRILLLLFPLFFYSPIHSQEQKTIYYDDNHFETTKENAAYYRVINYDKHGKPVGIIYDYFITGELKWKGKLLSDNPEDVFDGTCISYYHNGKQKEKCFYADSLKNGPDSTFYYNGKVCIVTNYKNDLEDGNYSSFGRNGLMLSKSVFKNGKLNGPYASYYEDGKLNYKVNYVNGLMEGKNTEWYDDGKITFEENYLHDTLNGKRISYFENGKLSSMETYKMGNKVGKCFQLQENSTDTATVELFSQSGYELETREYGSDGKIQQWKITNPADSIWTSMSFNDSGKVYESLQGYDDRQVGRQLRYYENGNLQEAEWYDKNYNKYSDTVWFESGKMETISNGLDNKRSKKKFDENGKLIGESFPDSLSLHIAKDNVSCFYGFKNAKDQWVVNPRYNNIQERKNGFYIVDLNEKWGVVDYFGKEIISPQYDDIQWLTFTQNSDEYYYRDVYSDAEMDYKNNFGIFMVVKDRMKGVVDQHNKIIIPLEYDQINFEAGDRLSLKKGDDYTYGDLTGFISTLRSPSQIDFSNRDYAVFVQFQEDSDQIGGIGLIDYSGKIIIPPIYDKVYLDGMYVYDSIVWVMKNGTYGCCNLKGEKILDAIYNIDNAPGYDEEQNYFFEREPFIVNRKNKYGMVNRKGEFLIDMNYDSLNVIFGNCIQYEKNKKYGLMDENGKTFSKRLYSKILYTQKGFSDYDDGYGETTSMPVLYNGKWGVVNDRDSILLPFIYSHASMDGSMMSLMKDDSLISYNCFGSNMVRDQDDPEEEDMKPMETYCFHDQAYDGNCGVVNGFGKMILPPDYYIDHISPNLILFRDREQRIGVDVPNEKPIFLSNRFQQPDIKDDGIIFVSTASGKVGVINSKGVLIVDTIFYALHEEKIKSSNVFWVKTSPPVIVDNEARFEGNWGLLNSNGKFILQPEWDGPSVFWDSIAIVKNHFGFGLISSSGKILLANDYDQIIRDVNGFYLLKKNNLYGFADPQGKIIASPKWKSVSGFMTNYMLCHGDNEKVELINEKGKILASGNFLSASGWKMNLDSMFDFYEANVYSYEPGDEIESRRNKVIQEYYLLKEEVVDVKKRNSIANYLIAQAAEDYSYHVAFIRFDTTYSSFDFYWKATCNSYRYYDGYKAKSSCSICFLQANSLSFSDVKCSMLCPATSQSYGSNCIGKTTFENYQFCGDSLCQIHLEDLFDTTKDYKAFLNALILKKMSTLDDPEISCSEPTTYMKQVGQKFSLSDSTLTLYLPKSTEPNGYYTERYYVPIEIPYSTLQNWINKNGIIEKFSEEKKSKH